MYYAKSAASRIVEVADTIKAGDFEPSEAWAADTWAAIEALTKAMRKAGYPKLRKAPQKAADAPMPGQAGCPLGMRQKRQKAPPEGFRPGNRHPSPRWPFTPEGSPKAGRGVRLAHGLGRAFEAMPDRAEGRGLCCA